MGLGRVSRGGLAQAGRGGHLLIVSQDLYVRVLDACSAHAKLLSGHVTYGECLQNACTVSAYSWYGRDRKKRMAR